MSVLSLPRLPGDEMGEGGKIEKKLERRNLADRADSLDFAELFLTVDKLIVKGKNPIVFFGVVSRLEVVSSESNFTKFLHHNFHSAILTRPFFSEQKTRSDKKVATDLDIPSNRSTKKSVGCCVKDLYAGHELSGRDHGERCQNRLIKIIPRDQISA